MERFNRAREIFIDEVGEEFGNNIWKELTEGVEVDFPEPGEPVPTVDDNGNEVPVTQGQWRRYDKLLGECFDQQRKHHENRGKVFRKMLSEMGRSMRKRVEQHDTFESLQSGLNIGGLMKLMKTLVDVNDGTRYEFWVMSTTLRKLCGIQQGPKESNDAYGE